MKKRKLKKLSFQKNTISNLQGRAIGMIHVAGGASTQPCVVTLSLVLRCFGDDPGTTDPNTQGCSMECTSGCQDTFTCRDYSCDCIQ
ncbi:hypothetical protein C8N46_108157 [Kordia periserrulae]|uniref:Uncharacterized protein n=1 Tax=Kordia periserrulae TaxID=701523 RepID=A0A2T6BUV7_9FLAO|nr:hypothetical protein [Kordia periserrulae]PTX59844.1 hypothetical protein C8N46_108157 [Kordia periserrulae]